MVKPWISMPLWLRRSIQLVLAGTVFGFAAATWLYVISGLQGDYLRTVAFVMPFWYLWAVYAPLVVWLSTRFPIERGLVMARCFMHLSVAALLSLVHTGARFEFQPGFRDGIGADTAGPASLEPLFALAALELPVHVFIYSAILGGTHIVRYYRRSRERELTAARLEAQLVDARMLALQMQLNPHFLFNALNSIAMLVRDAEKGAAVDALEALSDLLRYVLDDSACQEVPLKSELEFIERYLAMEKIRFRDRLEVRTEVDRKTLDAMVPNLLLQPIVENAIRHGIESRADPTTITISACKDGPVLRLRVSDDGPGSHGTLARGGSGVGIRNTRRRLAQLYGEGALLVAKDAEPTGATIKMTLPFHTVPLANRDDS